MINFMFYKDISYEILKVKSIRHEYKMDAEDNMDSMTSSTSSRLEVLVDVMLFSCEIRIKVTGQRRQYFNF